VHFLNTRLKSALCNNVKLKVLTLYNKVPKVRIDKCMNIN